MTTHTFEVVVLESGVNHLLDLLELLHERAWHLANHFHTLLLLNSGVEDGHRLNPAEG